MPRLLVIGCGPAGIQIVRNLHKDFEVTLVEPKDYYEFTPGILRGLCDERHLETLQVSLEDALRGMAVKHLKGQVIELDARCASVAFEDGSRDTVDFDFAVIAVGSQYAGTSLWKGGNATTLAARKAQLQQTRQQLADLAARAGRVVLLGAGLVGVELAAELVEYFPQLRITLVDRTAEVLPLLPPDAQDYARKWLDSKGLDLRLGQELPLERQQLLEALGMEAEQTLVLPCAGLRFPGGGLVAKLGAGDSTGQICTNRAMQCVCEGDGIPVASGRIFALGDCAKVLGTEMRFTKDIYPAEAMVGVVVSNLRQLARGSDPRDLQEIPSRLQEMTLCSLGPHDCIHVMNGRVVTSGWLAAQLKHQVEVTKMGEMRQEMWGSLVWSLIPHW